MRQEIVLYVNGQKERVRGNKIFMPLSQFLREELGLTGTKVVCAEGDCGACTVLVSDRNAEEFYSINSCISPVFANDGKHIVTIEGLELIEQRPHAVQMAMVKGNGAQCGFCSPGFVMSLTDLYEHHKSVDEQLVKKYTTGNLCRCTGYKDIIKSALTVNLDQYRSVKEFFLNDKHSQELRELGRDSLYIKDGSNVVAIPHSLEEFFTYQEKFPQARILSAATDLGVLMNKGNLKNHQFIFIGRIAELNRLESDTQHIYIGANKTLHEIEDELEIYYPQFSSFLEEFASPQIKKRGTLVGNVANGSPIGDSLPFLLIAGTKLIIASKQGEREVAITDFYKGYKQLDLHSGELIVGIKLPVVDSSKTIKLYKVANRTHLDISTVSAAFYLVKSDTNTIEELRIAYGGVAATVIRFSDLEKSVVGKTFNLELAQELGEQIASSITPLSDVRSSAEYRKRVAKNLVIKFYYDVLGGLDE